jgi:hypothetical protein
MPRFQALLRVAYHSQSCCVQGGRIAMHAIITNDELPSEVKPRSTHMKTASLPSVCASVASPRIGAPTSRRSPWASRRVLPQFWDCKAYALWLLGNWLLCKQRHVMPVTSSTSKHILTTFCRDYNTFHNHHKSFGGNGNADLMCRQQPG